MIRIKRTDQDMSKEDGYIQIHPRIIGEFFLYFIVSIILLVFFEINIWVGLTFIFLGFQMGKLFFLFMFRQQLSIIAKEYEKNSR